MAEHTPGPWQWTGNTSGHGLDLVTAAPGLRGYVVMGFRRWGMRGATPVFRDAQNLLCRAADWFVRPQEHNPWMVTGVDHPDARLIAAAPEMLDALEELGRRFSQLAFTFGVWDQVQDSLAQIDAVQKKARGEDSHAGR